MEINEQFVWDRLSNEKLPIVLYGMGNGADKILDLCNHFGIKVNDIFASDEYVRGHTFRGYKVLKYSDILNKYDNCIVLLTFACFRADMLEKIEQINSRFEVLAPEVPLFDVDIFTPKTFMDNKDKIEKVYSLLADEQSRFTYTNLLNYKMSGKYQYLHQCSTDRAEIFENIIKLGANEDYVDLGAFNGDTIDEFLLLTKSQYSTITAFEPAEKNFKKLSEKVENLNLKNVNLVNKAAFDISKNAYISEKGGRNPFLSESGHLIQTACVDDVCRKASYIKFDVEGAEAEALLGCKNLIKKYAPSLLVSAYHKTNDFFELPLKILELNENYKIYMRHQPYIPAWETSVIAVK